MLLGAGKDLKIVRLAGGVAAGTDGSRQNLTAIDRAGYAGVAHARGSRHSLERVKTVR